MLYEVITRRLKSRGLNPKEINAILVTHEHSDHIQAVGVLSRQLKLPVYVSRKIQNITSLADTVHEMRTFKSGSPFQINNLMVHPFTVSHDAAEPVGFRIGQNGRCIGLATVITSYSIHYTKLYDIESSGFKIQEAKSLAALEQLVLKGDTAGFMISMADALKDMPACIADRNNFV